MTNLLGAEGSPLVNRRGNTIGRLLVADAPIGAAVLAYALLLPPVALLVTVLVGGVGTLAATEAATALAAYAAVLLSLHAGIRYGQLIRSDAGFLRLAAPLLAPLVGWAALLLPLPDAAAVLAAASAAQGASDVWAADGVRLPSWYGRLRARTTPIVVLALILAFLKLLP